MGMARSSPTAHQPHDPQRLILSSPSNKVTKQRRPRGPATLRCATGNLRCSGLAGSKKTRLRLKQFFALIRQTLRSSAHSHGGRRVRIRVRIRERIRERGTFRRFARRGSGVTLTPALSRAAGEGARRIQTRSKKEAEWSKWPKEQAGLEAVGERAVEPSASRHRHNRQSRLGQAERSAGPYERSARLRSQGNFLW